MKNSDTKFRIAILGVGEAGSRFAHDLLNQELGVSVVVWDPNPQRPLDAAIEFAQSNRAAAEGADLIMSVNLATVAAAVATEVAPVLHPNQFYLEMNTAAPQQKQHIAEVLRPSGVQLVDLAIMAPVPPLGLFTPLLASGPSAAALQAFVQPLALNLECLSDSQIGDAAMLKLLRSIVYKGIAGVIYEAVQAGKKLGQEQYLRQQILSIIGPGQEALIDRFLEGTYQHAARRQHEMEAVVAMLEDQGLHPFLSRAASAQLQAIAQQKT